MSSPALALPKPQKRAPRGATLKPRSERDSAKLREIADKLCGALVKRAAGYRCEHCKVRPTPTNPLDWAHAIGRSCKATRWAHANTYALCRLCHNWFGAHPEEFEWWRIVVVGGDRLDRMADQARAMRRVDVRAVIEGLRAGRFTQGNR